jgi:ABC-type transport system involved in cytochrome c biogenesis permease subunit
MYILLAAVSLYALGLMGGRLGRSSVLAGILVHTVHMVMRGIELGWLPVTERMDTLSLIGLFIMIIYVIASCRQTAHSMEYYFIPLAAFFTFMGILHQPVNAVDIFMETPWFFIFIITNIIGYALLAAGTAFGLSYLFHDDEGAEPRQHAFTLYGWAVFSVSLLSGSVWFFLSYGSYWYWTAKEFWSSVIWLYLAIYLHSRYISSFRGRPAAVIGVLAFPLLIFNYFGIGTIIKSPWSQF